MKRALFKIFDSVMDHLGDDTLAMFDVHIAMVGATGVGKTTSCNALLGSNWNVGHTTATTRDLQSDQLILDDNGKSVPTNIYVTDFPGLGESLSRDAEYLPLYKEHLPRFDAVVWVMAANDRQMAATQQYLNALSEAVPELASKLIIALNKADLVEPMEWAKDQPNLPSDTQMANIEARVHDVVARLNEECCKCRLPEAQVVAFTAKYNWRVWKVFEILNTVLKGGKKMSLVRFARPQQWSPKRTK